MVYNIPNWIIAITVVGTWLIITIPGMPPVFIAAMIVFAAFIIWYAFTQLYFSASYNNVLNIYLTNNLEGGGDMYTQDVLNFVARNVGKVDSVFEYCAGPGFMGFFLLAHDMCRTLSLADISPQAVKAMNMTVEENKLQDRVRVYQSDCLEAISADERWDFVVANPPWWLTNKKSPAGAGSCATRTGVCTGNSSRTWESTSSPADRFCSSKAGAIRSRMIFVR